MNIDAQHVVQLLVMIALILLIVYAVISESRRYRAPYHDRLMPVQSPEDVEGVPFNTVFTKPKATHDPLDRCLVYLMYSGEYYPVVDWQWAGDGDVPGDGVLVKVRFNGHPDSEEWLQIFGDTPVWVVGARRR